MFWYSVVYYNYKNNFKFQKTRSSTLILTIITQKSANRAFSKKCQNYPSNLRKSIYKIKISSNRRKQPFIPTQKTCIQQVTYN